MFAKLYETKLGQILVKKDTNEDSGNPEIRVYFEPEGFGVCHIDTAMRDDSESSWNDLDTIFDKITSKTAVKAVKAVLDSGAFSIKSENSNE